MAGCSSGSGPARTAPATSTVPPTLELATPEPSKGPTGVDELQMFTGTLGSDVIEGGCVYLETGDGRRLEVIYPDGWQVRRSPLGLVRPDGTVVAEAGGLVTIRGVEAQDMVSICQIGPIVRAFEVLPG